MDEEHARDLLAAERLRVELLLRQSRTDAADDREAENESGVDIADPAERLTAEGLDDSVVESLEARLHALERAESRLAAGTYGRSVESGAPIPDERLEADPAAELTVDEAARQG